MSEQPRVPIVKLATGVPGLDEVLGGGLPEYSLNLITGTPGAGKTTLALQILFALASPARPALYFTILGEPPLKMLRYQQQFAFFDPARVGESIHFVNLSDALLDGGLRTVLAEIIRRAEEIGPGLVVVDSFRGLVRAVAGSGSAPLELADFTQRLTMRLTGARATTFLVGEYSDDEARDDPAFAVADGILHLSKDVERNATVRKLQVPKLRGQASRPGLHLFRIGTAGVQVFPRVQLPPEPTDRPLPFARVDIGVPGLDELMDGGPLVGDAVLVGGPSGAGKSVLTMQFVVAGARVGEPGVVAIFDEGPGAYLRRAAHLGFDLVALERAGLLRLLYLRALDLSPGEVFQAIREATAAIGARRVVIDSLSGFELALAPSYRGEEYRESLYRLVGALTGGGVTVLATVESSEDTIADLRISAFAISILADDIIVLRYAEERPGLLLKSVAVIKMRGSVHGAEFRPYAIAAGGIVVGDAPRDEPGGAAPGGPPGAG